MTWEGTLVGAPKPSNLDATRLWAIVRDEIVDRMYRRGSKLRARTVRRDDDPGAPRKASLDLAPDARLTVNARELAWFRFEPDLGQLLASDEILPVCQRILEQASLPWLLVWARQHGAAIDSYAPATWTEARGVLPPVESEGLWLLVRHRGLKPSGRARGGARA